MPGANGVFTWVGSNNRKSLDLMETEIEKAYPVEEFDPTLKHVLGT